MQKENDPCSHSFGMLAHLWASPHGKKYGAPSSGTRETPSSPIVAREWNAEVEISFTNLVDHLWVFQDRLDLDAGEQRLKSFFAFAIVIPERILVI